VFTVGFHRKSRFRYFWEKILDSGVTVNGGYFARFSKEITRDIELAKKDMLAGYLPSKGETIYIVDDGSYHEFYEELAKDSSNRLLNYIQTLDDIKYILSDSRLFRNGESIDN
jgi:hypothetical protein